MSQVPWDALRITTIRAILKDLQMSEYAGPAVPRRELIKILQNIETDGVDTVRQELEDRPTSEAASASRGQSPAISYAGPVRDESPELEYITPPRHEPPSRSRRKAAIPPPPQVSSSAPPPPKSESKAGPSEPRPRPRVTKYNAHLVSVPITRVGPPLRKRPKIPMPSYAIIWQKQQQQQISPYSNEVVSRSRPANKFDGVYVPSVSARKQQKRPASPGLDYGVDDAVEFESASQAGIPPESVSEVPSSFNVCASSERIAGGAPSRSRRYRMDAVVITKSSQMVEAEWRKRDNTNVDADEPQ